MKPKLLCILHRSPPFHGAAKVGDFISESVKLNEKYNCKFITIKSSDIIGDIGKVNFKKFYLVAELYMKVLFTLLIFRPDKLYFTASVRGVALYRDILISTLWKIYSLFASLDIYYHYHTKGINEVVSSSSQNLKLTNFFVKNVNMVLLSPLLEKDIEKLTTYKSILLLPNGVEDTMLSENFNSYFENKYNNIDTIQVLYLAHMMRDKGYWEALKLVKVNKGKNIHFNFAGSWKDKKNEIEFFTFIKEHQLEENITYHGFVSGEQKDTLFKNAHLLLYPSKNDAFPLTLLEALSYGVPVLATNEGSIPYILDDKSGIVIKNLEKLEIEFNHVIKKFINIKSAELCRQRYIDNFNLEQFEENLIKVFK